MLKKNILSNSYLLDSGQLWATVQYCSCDLCFHQCTRYCLSYAAFCPGQSSPDQRPDLKHFVELDPHLAVSLAY